jgi:hypothetical protein
MESVQSLKALISSSIRLSDGSVHKASRQKFLHQPTAVGSTTVDLLLIAKRSAEKPFATDDSLTAPLCMHMLMQQQQQQQ